MSTLQYNPFVGAPPLEDAERSLADILRVLRRRRQVLLGVFALLLTVSLLVAWLLPSVYRSTATILIKEQEIPQELVRSTVTSYADERIQVITQQVMTRSTLLELVERNQLYGSDRLRASSEDIIDRMRRDIRITPISADVTDRRTGSPVRSTIAFTLSYDSEVAANAQKIANELVTLFLNENVKNRQQKAAETTSFLDDELARISDYVSGLEARLSEFKRRNQGRLPETNLANQVISERQLADLQRLEREILFVEERRQMLQAQLAETRPSAPVQGSGGAVLEPEDRLRALQVQLISLTGLYSDDHPDVRRLKREIAAFKQETGLQWDAADRETRLAELRNTLATLRQRYSDEHPDVVKLKRAYAGVESAMRAGADNPALPRPSVSAPRRPDNPAYINLNAQLQGSAAQAQALRAERDVVKAKVEQIDLRLSQAPEVEREFLALSRDLDSSRARFREMREKQAQAQVAEQLERGRKAERFTLIEPPIYPEKPQRPNRAAIAWIGVVLSLLASVAVAALRESLDQGVYGVKSVARVTRVPVLAVLPAAAPRGAVRAGLTGRLSNRRVAQALAVLALLIGAAGLAAMHYFVLPLDVAWFSLLRRLGG